MDPNEQQSWLSLIWASIALMFLAVALIGVAYISIFAAPFLGAWFIWFIVRRINSRDEKRADDPFREVRLEVLQGLTPHQRGVLKSCLQRPRR